MDLSRRRMLQGMVAGAVAAASPIRWAAAASAAPAKSDASPPWFSRASYGPLVGTAFTAGTATMKLVGIGDLTPQPVKEKASLADGRFSLLFTSAATMDQGTVTVRHAALGECPLFVVPVGPAGTVKSYEVVVNRMP